MMDPPELVTLLPEEEEAEPPVSEDLKIVRRLILDVTVLIGLKVAMVFATRRLTKTVRELHKLDFPRQRYSE